MEVSTNVIEYQCPCCGAGLRFGGINMINEAWLACYWSEAIAIVAYALLIIYLVRASMKVK